MLQLGFIFFTILVAFGLASSQKSKDPTQKTNDAKPVSVSAVAKAEDMQTAASGYQKSYEKPKPKKPYYG